MMCILLSVILRGKAPNVSITLASGFFTSFRMTTTAKDKERIYK